MTAWVLHECSSGIALVLLWYCTRAICFGSRFYPSVWSQAQGARRALCEARNASLTVAAQQIGASKLVSGLPATAKTLVLSKQAAPSTVVGKKRTQHVGTRATLVLHWNCAGIVLRWCFVLRWHRTATALVPHTIPQWYHTGTTLVQHWCHTGTTLVPLWYHTGAPEVLDEYNTGTTRVPPWYWTGTALVPRWHYTGTALALYWQQSGTNAAPVKY